MVASSVAWISAARRRHFKPEVGGVGLIGEEVGETEPDLARFIGASPCGQLGNESVAHPSNAGELALERPQGRPRRRVVAGGISLKADDHGVVDGQGQVLGLQGEGPFGVDGAPAPGSPGASDRRRR